MAIEKRSIALLIDAENISAKYIEIIIDEANKYGNVTYRRVYGDWQSDHIKPWREKVNDFALTQVQQNTYTKSRSKNVSDFTLIIDAMDILYSGKVEGFCIVSSDSDFTKLVTRLREDNMFVMGMGESKTPLSLVNACETFSYLDKMYHESEEDVPQEDEGTQEEAPPKEGKPARKPSKKKKNGKAESSITPLKKIESELENIIENNVEDDGWAYWSIVADLLQKKYPAFHPRNYGQNIRPLTFFKRHKAFEVKIEDKVAYIRNKKS